jgi:Cytochrome c554 and c-prime
MRTKTSLQFFLILSAWVTAAPSWAQVKVQPRTTAPTAQAPTQETGESAFSGPESCAASNCHGGVQPKTVVRISQNEYSIWAGQDKHARAYTVLSNPVSVRMGRILGLAAAPNQSDKCLNCHTLNVKPERRAQTFQSTDGGVSCENCHGPAVKWLGPHTLKNWTHEQSVKLGMYDTRDLARRTEKCLSCHLGTGEKEVDHTMIAAGHPDLTFQLDTFSSAMPRHWKAPADASAWLSVRELAVGQAVQLREALNRLNRRASGPHWPEFAEYECFACHHSLTTPEASWRQAAGYRSRLPGAPVWNPSTYTVFRHVAAGVDPGTMQQLTLQLVEVQRISGNPANKEDLATRAKDAAALTDQITQQLKSQPYDRNLTTKLLQEIADDSETISAEGERSAEQATMALDSLSLAYEKNEQLANQAQLRAAINDLFQQLGNPSAYNAPKFAQQMQKVAKLVPRSRAQNVGELTPAPTVNGRSSSQF